MTSQNIAIVGATRGIGWAFAEEAAKRKHSLLLVGRSKIPKDKLDHLFSLGATNVQAIQSDLLEKSALTHLQDTVRNFQPDILFNNAAISAPGLYEKLEEQEIENLISVNILGPLLVTRSILPEMIKRKSGLIINHSSTTVLGFPAMSVYTATKAALAAFSRSLAMELHSTGVRTLTLFNGPVKTVLFESAQDRLKPHFLHDLNQIITPKKCANRIWWAIDNNLRELYPPGVIGLFFRVMGLFPITYQKQLARAFFRNSRPEQ